MQIDTTIQQIKDLLHSESIQRILVTSGTNVDPDALGSALAVASALENSLGKSVTVAIEGFDNARYSFLPGIEKVLPSIGQKSLVVSIDVASNPIEKINYNAEGTTFNLILTPKFGQVNTDQISYSYAGLPFDLVIAVDTATKKLLGQWVEDFADELKDIPLINIDHHGDNEQFGTLNVVQSDQPAAASVLVELLVALDLPLSADSATNLLAGIMYDTSGFNNSNASAETLRQAATLVDAGANLQVVMQGLFRSMSMAALHLWSKVLATIEEIEPGIIVAQVLLKDIAETGATEVDQDSLDNLVNGLITAIPGAKVALVLKEKSDTEVRGSLRAIDVDINVSPMAKEVGGGGHPAASGFRLMDTSLELAKSRVLTAIRAHMPPVEAAPQLESPALITEEEPSSL